MLVKLLPEISGVLKHPLVMALLGMAVLLVDMLICLTVIVQQVKTR